MKWTPRGSGQLCSRPCMLHWSPTGRSDGHQGRNGLPVAGESREIMGIDYRTRIVRDPKVCGGDPVIKGTRVPLRTILASLAEGDAVADILRDFPSLTEEDLRAVIAFAAASAEEDLPVLEVPRVA